MLLWLGCAISGLAVLGIEYMLDSAILITQAFRITPFLITFFILSLVQNMITTCLYSLLTPENTL